MALIPEQISTQSLVAKSDRAECTESRSRISVAGGDRSNQLIKGLSLVPESWALTPLRGNKAPYRPAWQHETPLTRGEIIAEIESNEAKGYGIRTGTISGGMVAIDFDGSSAMQKALELSKGEPLPDTVSFTSNRPGREQRLYLIPQEYWKAVRTTKIKTGVVGDDGKLEQLELRWDGCQSVLPPSIHPMTGHYRWRKSPKEVAIAPAPMWVIEAMLVDTEGADTPLLNHQSPTQEQNPWTDTDWALSYLNALSSFRADDYDDWLAVGMALHSVSDSLLTDWNSWSRQSPKYKPGDCEKKWKSFKREGKIAIGTLAHMAKQDGWRSFSGGIGSSSNGGSRRGGSGGSGGDDGGDGGNGKIVTHPKFTPITSDELDQRLNELIAQNIIGSKLTTHLHRLAVEAQWHINELKKLYFERKSETEQTEEQGTKLANVKPGAI